MRYLRTALAFALAAAALAAVLMVATGRGGTEQKVSRAECGLLASAGKYPPACNRLAREIGRREEAALRSTALEMCAAVGRRHCPEARTTTPSEGGIP